MEKPLKLYPYLNDLIFIYLSFFPDSAMSSKIRFARYFLFIAVLLFSLSASAQTSYNNIVFKIDSLIEVGLPKSALKEVTKLNVLARKENNVAQIVRATIYNLKFQSYIQEDALVSIIRTLKSDIDHSAYPVKPILQSFLADMYWQYYQDNRYQFAGRSKLTKPAIDFRNWDFSSLIDETIKLYKLSLKDVEEEQNTPVNILDGILIGDKNTRFLRPTLYDLLLHRSFKFFLAEEPAITKPKLPFTLNHADFFSDAKTFANLVIKTTDTASTAYQGIKFLQQGINYHLRDKPGQALADLDLKRVSFIYKNTTLSDKDSLYDCFPAMEECRFQGIIIQPGEKPGT